MYFLWIFEGYNNCDHTAYSFQTTNGFTDGNNPPESTAYKRKLSGP